MSCWYAPILVRGMSFTQQNIASAADRERITTNIVEWCLDAGAKQVTFYEPEGACVLSSWSFVFLAQREQFVIPFVSAACGLNHRLRRRK
jgi:hypothetical protein